MSYQYIYPNYYNKVQQFTFPAPNQIPQNQFSIVQTNPYQTSFYNTSSSIYPFNPLYQPKITTEYAYLGKIKSPNNDDVHLFKLKNGQNVAIMPAKNQATIVKTFLKDGSINEIDAKSGIKHVIEHMDFKGSSKLKDGDVFNLTGLMGASTNASTDYAQTDFYITAPYMDKQNLDKTIEIQGDMLSNPTFDKNALESEKGPICSEISMINDDIATIAYDKLIRNMFQIKSDSKNLVAGSIETVQNLTNDDLIDCHQTYYNPDNMYTVVVGDVDIESTIEEIAKNFTIPKTQKNTTPMPQRELTPITNPQREDIISSKTSNTTVMMGFSGPLPNDGKSLVILSLLQDYLSNFSSSDLKNNLEKINGDFVLSSQKVGLKENDPYAMVAVMDLNPNDEQKGIDIFYDAIQKIQTQGISDNDLIALKNYLYKSLEYVLSDSESCCNILAASLMNNSGVFTNYKAYIDSITKEDIKEFVKKYFDLNKVSMMVIHPDTVSSNEINNNYQQSKYSYQQKQPNQTNGISFQGNPKVSTSRIREYTTQNNTHLAINDSNSNICAFKWVVSTPPIKAKNPNLPDILAYMFQKGSEYKNQSELEKFQEFNGIDSSVFVNGRCIEITADCLQNKTDETLALMNELMYHPRLTENDFNDAKQYVKDMLNAAQKDAGSNLLDKLYPDYFPNLNQKLKTIDNLKYEDVIEFYNQLLQNSKSDFAATMPTQNNPALAHNLIDKLNQGNIKFKQSNQQLTPIFEANPNPNVIYDIDDLNQAQIYKSYKFPISGNIEDEAKFELVNMILGGSANGRLFKDLREQQNLAYSVYSDIQSFENTGILTLGIQTTTDHKDQGQTSYENVQKSLEGFQKHTDKLCNELVSDIELESAKNKLRQQLIGLCQNTINETKLISMNMMEPYGIKRIDKYLEAVDKITKEDIQKASQFIFSQNPTISILASEDTINSQMEYLKTLGNIEQVQ